MKRSEAIKAAEAAAFRWGAARAASAKAERELEAARMKALYAQAAVEEALDMVCYAEDVVLEAEED